MLYKNVLVFYFILTTSKMFIKCFTLKRAVDFMRLGRVCKMLLKCFILHVTTSKNVLAAVKILQNILAVSCLLPNIHEPASMQSITVFPWLT